LRGFLFTQKLLTETVVEITVVAIVVANVELTIVVAIHVHGITVRIKSLFCENPSIHRVPYAKHAEFFRLQDQLCLESLFHRLSQAVSSLWQTVIHRYGGVASVFLADQLNSRNKYNMKKLHNIVAQFKKN